MAIVNQLPILTPCQRPKVTPKKSKKMLRITPLILSLATKVAQVFSSARMGQSVARRSRRKNLGGVEHQPHSLFFSR